MSTVTITATGGSSESSSSSSSSSYSSSHVSVYGGNGNGPHAAPEINGNSAIAAMTLLIGGLLVIMSRRRI